MYIRLGLGIVRSIRFGEEIRGAWEGREEVEENEKIVT